MTAQAQDRLDFILWGIRTSGKSRFGLKNMLERVQPSDYPEFLGKLRKNNIAYRLNPLDMYCEFTKA